MTAVLAVFIGETVDNKPVFQRGTRADADDRKRFLAAERRGVHRIAEAEAVNQHAALFIHGGG